MTKRKTSTELQSSANKDARTESPSGLDTTDNSFINSSRISNGGSPLLRSSITPGQRQSRITDHFLTQSTQSTPSRTQSISPRTQLTPPHSNSDDVFDITETHHALLDVATDIFSTPSARPHQEMVTIKATDFESLLSATNNMQKNIVKLVAQVDSQKQQIQNTLKNQDKIMKELTSLKAAANSIATANTVPGPSAKVLHTGQTKHVQSDKNKKKEPINSRNKTSTNSSASHQAKQNKRVSAPIVNNTTTNNIDKHIDKYMPMWRKKHFYRRSEYLRYHMSSEKSKIIEDHISRKYIPRRFRPRQTHTKAEYILEEKHSFATMKHEGEKFKFHAENAKSNFNATDQEIFETIDVISEISEADQEKLKEQWLNEVTQAVDKAHELCDYNLAFLKDLPQTHPYHGFSASNNNVQQKSRNQYTYNSNPNRRQQRNFY